MSLPEAVLFDLDGTLIDSVPDIHAATNALLALHGYPALPLDALRDMVGDGVSPLVARAFAAHGERLDADALAARVAEMMPIYARHLTGLTEIMPGAPALLETLAAAGVKLAIVSNKPHAFVQEIAVHYGFAEHLGAVEGARDGVAKKPAPDMLVSALRTLGVASSDAAIVGDGPADALAGRSAGTAVVLLEAGYGMRPSRIEADVQVAGLGDVEQALRRLWEARLRS
jgi:phosphoglycolate phosphatase